MKIIVSRTELLAALLFASQDESRYTLNGVNIEVNPTHHTPVMVATDGRRIAVIETVAEQPQEEIFENQSMLLAADFVKAVCSLSKAIGGKLFPWIQFQTRPGSQQTMVEFIGNGTTLNVESRALIEGIFPNWRQCLPAKSKKRDPITDIGLNAEMIGDFAKAAKLLEAPTPIVQMNLVGKEQQIEVKIIGRANFYGLVMQCKLDESVDYQPEFLAISKAFPTADKITEEES